VGVIVALVASAPGRMDGDIRHHAIAPAFWLAAPGQGHASEHEAVFTGSFGLS
jgi:hypothetical protein